MTKNVYGPDRASVAGCCCADVGGPVGDWPLAWFPRLDTFRRAGTATTISAASPTAAQSFYASRLVGPVGPEGRGGSHLLRALVPPPSPNKMAGRSRLEQVCGPQHLGDRDGAALTSMGTIAHFTFGRRVAGQRHDAVAAQLTLNGGSLGLHGPRRGVARSPFDKVGALPYLGWTGCESTVPVATAGGRDTRRRLSIRVGGGAANAPGCKPSPTGQTRRFESCPTHITHPWRAGAR
jgi:hypothetical protein